MSFTRLIFQLSFSQTIENLPWFLLCNESPDDFIFLDDTVTVWLSCDLETPLKIFHDSCFCDELSNDKNWKYPVLFRNERKSDFPVESRSPENHHVSWLWQYMMIHINELQMTRCHFKWQSRENHKVMSLPCHLVTHHKVKFPVHMVKIIMWRSFKSNITANKIPVFHFAIVTMRLVTSTEMKMSLAVLLR